MPAAPPKAPAIIALCIFHQYPYVLQIRCRLVLVLPYYLVPLDMLMPWKCFMTLYLWGVSSVLISLPSLGQC